MFKVFIFAYFIYIILGFTLLTSTFANPDIAFNGNVDYILQYEYIKNNSENMNSAAPDYINSYKWNLNLKIIASEHLFFGIRFSNPSGYYGDVIKENTTWIINKQSNLLAIPELYFSWNTNIVSLTAGIIPVKSNTTLSLAAYESNKSGYLGVGTYTWKELMNNSQKGLDIGLNILNKDVYTIGLHCITSMAEDAAGTVEADAFKLDKIRVLVTIPIELTNITMSILPAIHTKTNTFRSSDYSKADHSIAGGCDITIKPIEQLAISLGAAGGIFKNESQKNDSMKVHGSQDSVIIDQISPFGILLSTDIVYMPGFGDIQLKFNIGQYRDRKGNPVKNNYVYLWDIKYTIPINKLSIVPQVRVWHHRQEDSDATKTIICPELKLRAEF